MQLVIEYSREPDVIQSVCVLSRLVVFTSDDAQMRKGN